VVRVRPKKINLTRRERKILEASTRGRKCARGLCDRAQVILYWADGIGVRETARRLKVHYSNVMRWRERWFRTANERRDRRKDWDHKKLREKIHECLGDTSRSGAPVKFTAEQMCKVMSIACKEPGEFGIPVSHWSAAELTREVLRQGVVEGISVRTVGRFLKRLTSGHTVCATG